ncbi:MAG: nuclear transport factor 2 family protein [Pseudomonadota bacterium]
MTTEETVRAALDAYARGDLDAAMAHCADTICFCNLAAPNSGLWQFDCHGQAAVRAAFTQIATEFAFEKYEIVELIASGNRAASRQKLRGRHRLTGAVFDSQIADFFTVEDGKITHIQEFHDTALLSSLRIAARQS